MAEQSTSQERTCSLDVVPWIGRKCMELGMFVEKIACESITPDDMDHLDILFERMRVSKCKEVFSKVLYENFHNRNYNFPERQKIKAALKPLMKEYGFEIPE